MDRNLPYLSVAAVCKAVALRKESVDRNYSANAVDQILPVALRKESVDRNGLGFRHYRDDVASLSARRAWIEILFCVVFSSGAKGRSPQGERG